MSTLDGHVSLVLGGATGIGAAVATTLRARGAIVVVGDLVPPEGGLLVDITDEAGLAAVVAAVEGEHGRIDSLVNVVADTSILLRDTDALSLDLEVWDRTLAVNLRGQLLAVRAVLPGMLARGGGRIVTMTSGAAYAGEPVRPAYAASKAGLTALTRHVAARWGRKGIRCNAVAPGVVETAASQGAMGPMWETMAKYNPTGRNGRPEDIAGMVAFLVGPDAEWVNGQVLGVDGGSLMR